MTPALKHALAHNNNTLHTHIHACTQILYLVCSTEFQEHHEPNIPLFDPAHSHSTHTYSTHENHAYIHSNKAIVGINHMLLGNATSCT